MTTLTQQSEAVKAVEARLKGVELSAIQKAAKVKAAEAKRVSTALQPQKTAAEKLAAQRAAEAKKLAVKTDNPSPVQRQISARAAQQAKAANYMESEDYLRMAAFEIKRRIDMYRNLGLNTEYAAAQQEGAAVVQKYQALLAAGKIKGDDTSTTA